MVDVVATNRQAARPRGAPRLHARRARAKEKRDAARIGRRKREGRGRHAAPRRRRRAGGRAACRHARVAAAALVIVSALLAASIAFVPLDDRPVTLQLPVMLGAIAGERIDTPPPAMLGRYLQPGRPDDIIAWLNAPARSARRLRRFDRHAGIRRADRIARSRPVVCGCRAATARVRTFARAASARVDRRICDDRSSRSNRRSGKQRIFCGVSGVDVPAAICEPARSAAAAGRSGSAAFARIDRRTAVGRISRRPRAERCRRCIARRDDRAGRHRPARDRTRRCRPGRPARQRRSRAAGGRRGERSRRARFDRTGSR